MPGPSSVTVSRRPAAADLERTASTSVRRVPDRVVDEVGQHPAQRRRGRRRHEHRPGRRRPRTGHPARRRTGRPRSREQRPSVDRTRAGDGAARRRRRGPAAAGPRPARTAGATSASRSAGSRPPSPSRWRHLELGPHDRQRAAQLVGGVGDERPLPRAPRRQPVEHVVEGHGQRVRSRRGSAAPAAVRPWPAPLIRAAPARSSSTGRSARPITRHAMTASTASSSGIDDQQRACRSDPLAALEVARPARPRSRVPGGRRGPAGDGDHPQRPGDPGPGARHDQRPRRPGPRQLRRAQQRGEPVGGRPSR